MLCGVLHESGHDRTGQYRKSGSCYLNFMHWRTERLCYKFGGHTKNPQKKEEVMDDTPVPAPTAARADEDCILRKRPAFLPVRR